MLRRRSASRPHRRERRHQRARLSKNLFGGVVGNVLEWYDFAVFGFFASTIGEKFFPSRDPLDSLISAFSVFAAAYLVRPFGGILFGYIGDQVGRRRALQLSVMLMAVPTFLIGVLPTHDEVGTLAPFLLVLLRIGQGLSVGGELIGSMVFVAETAPRKQRGFFSSWTFASCYAGIMLGSLSAVGLDALLGARAMADWGWRLPFLSGIVIGIAGLWMRTGLSETPVFDRIKEKGGLDTHPLAEAMQRVTGRIVHAAVLVVMAGGGFYLLFVWWPTLLGRLLQPHVPHAMALNTLSIALLIVLIPITGRLSDEVGRKPLLVLGTAAMMLCSWPLFTLVAQGGVVPALAAHLCFTVLMSIYLGPIPATLVEMFPSRIRYSALGLGYNISLSLFGGTAPLVATWLFRRDHDVSGPALYLVLLSGLSLGAALMLPERRRIRRAARSRPGGVTGRKQRLRALAR